MLSVVETSCTSLPLSSFSQSGLHTPNWSWQTRVGKNVLVCVNGTKTVGKHVGKLLATKRTCLYSRQLFHQLFRVDKLVFDVWTIGIGVFVTVKQDTRSMHVFCVKLYKMADGRENREATFQFIEEVQNCPDLCGMFRVQRIKTRNTSVLYTLRVGFLLMNGFVLTFLFYQRFLFLLRRLTYNRTMAQAATLSQCHCYTSAVLQITVRCVEICPEFDVFWSLPTRVCQL